MIKEFSILVSMVVLFVAFVSLHYLTYNESSAKEVLSSVTKITKISSASLSVAYYEPRILMSQEALNPAYPQMQTINKMDLVYAQ